jgi:hypothetical protein
MGFFRPSRKFTEMRTPEEQYRAQQSQAQQAYEPSHAYQETQRRLSERAAQRRAATQERRSQVVSAGTMRRRGRTVILEGDWKLATGKLPTGDLSGMEFKGGKVGDLTLKDLHAMAANHGPKCQCGIDRR